MTVLRPVALAAAAAAAVSAGAAGSSPALVTSPEAWQDRISEDPTGAVAMAASGALWLLVGILGVGALATLAAELPGAAGRVGERASRILAPAALRAVVRLSLGAAMGAGVLAPVGALAATPPRIAIPAMISAWSGLAARQPAVSLPSPFPPLGEPAGSIALATPPAPLPEVAPGQRLPATTPGSVATSGQSTVPVDPVAPVASSQPTGQAAPAHPRTATPAHPPTATPAHPPTATPAHPSTATPAPPAHPPTATPGPPATHPAGRHPAGRHPAGRNRPGSRGTPVVVHTGDTLWRVAQQALPNGASDAQIAAAWPRWWAANRAVIGADPDVIRPGEVLRPPA